MQKLLNAGLMIAMGLMFSVPPGCFGQNYPSKPVRFITFGVGGDTDFAARLIAQGIAGSLGQSVVVENRGSGVIPGETVHRAPADGYSVLVAGGNFWILPLFQKAPYDVGKDFQPVTYIAKSPLVLALHPSVPARSVRELIALAKANPGALSYASSNAGSSTLLASQLLEYMVGIKLQGVPFSRGGAAKLISLISGEVDLMFDSPGVLMPHAKAGKLRAVGITSAQPSVLTPGLPTLANSGFPGYEIVGSAGVFVLSKTSPAIVKQLNHDMVRFLRLPDTKAKFESAGAEVVGSSPEEFSAVITAEQSSIAKMIRDTRLKTQ